MQARQFEFDPDTIVVNRGESVRLRITSEDVTHGFGLSDFGIERTLPPSETQIVEFTANQAGQHHFHCTEYCGEGHDDMHGELVVQAD
jgi:heme/copper-type cytochrome/quinol oxidase subunit 2